MSELALWSRAVPHKITDSITFYSAESEVNPAASQSGCRPLLLLLPWLGSQPRALAKYCEVYFRTGFDILVVESTVSQFLWPRWGLDYGEKVLEVLLSDRFVSRPLLVHAFSIGAFTFAQLLVHVSRDVTQYPGLTDRIKGHIYDSLVMGSLDQMAIGLGKTIFPRWEGLVTQSSLLYFRAFRKYTVDYYDSGVHVFRNCPVVAPALFFYCENDAMCDHEQMDEMIEFWRKQGVVVKSKKWEKSTHAGHLRHHRQEYLSILDDFLQSLNGSFKP